jgi:hypothetical protein
MAAAAIIAYPMTPVSEWAVRIRATIAAARAAAFAAANTGTVGDFPVRIQFMANIAAPHAPHTSRLRRKELPVLKYVTVVITICVQAMIVIKPQKLVKIAAGLFTRTTRLPS